MQQNNKNKENKIKIFFNDTAKCFKNISRISCYILIIGQFLIAFALLAFAFYINYIRDSKEHELFAHAFYTAKIFFDNAIAGLSVLWGGALFIDYLEKRSK